MCKGDAIESIFGKPHVICQRVEYNAFHLDARGGSAPPKTMATNRRRCRLRTWARYNTPTAREISKTTMLSEIKT